MYTDIQNTQLTITWTNGSGQKRVVFASQNAGSKSNQPQPVDGTTYSPDNEFGSGDEIGSSGWYCVYNGNGSEVTVTGLTPNTNYNFMVCEYNGSEGNEYYNSSSSTNNPNEIASVPLSIWSISLAIILVLALLYFRLRNKIYARLI